MQAACWIYKDANIIPNEKLFFLEDTAVSFGHAAFTTIRVQEACVECFDAHITRLNEICSALSIAHPAIDKEALFALLEKNNALSGMWRLKITVAAQKNSASSHVYMQLFPYKPSQCPARVCFFSYTPSSLTGSIKHLGYLDHFLLRKKAEKFGFDDCILHTEDKVLLEASFANIIWEKEGQFFTQDRSLGIIPGIMLQNIEHILKEQGKKLHFVKASCDALDGTSVYLTNSLMWIRPVAALCGFTLLRNIPQERMLFLELERKIALESLHYSSKLRKSL